MKCKICGRIEPELDNCLCSICTLLNIKTKDDLRIFLKEQAELKEEAELEDAEISEFSNELEDEDIVFPPEILD